MAEFESSSCMQPLGLRDRRRPYTPWSTTNADYGKSMYNTEAQAADATNVVETEEISKELVDDNNGGDSKDNQRAPSTLAPVGAGYDNNENISPSIEPEQKASDVMLSSRDPRGSSRDPRGSSDHVRLNEKMMTYKGQGYREVEYEHQRAPARNGLPSRGAARRFMQEECPRFLDNLQAIRGLQGTSEGRVQVLTLQDAPAEIMAFSEEQ